VIAPLAVLVCAASALASGSVGPKALSGQWSGTYRCAQGLTGLQLNVKTHADAITAVFGFHPLVSNPTVPVGSFSLKGTFYSASDIVLTQNRWLHQPIGYVMVNLVGKLQDRGRRFTGRVVGPGCSSFSLGKK
jgi:hypothetical protein